MTNLTPTNLLLVDDHTLVTDGLIALLGADNNFDIKGVAQSGIEAIEMLKALKIDVVLMDVDMPEMNGIDAVKFIKKNLPDIRVIMLTMHDEKAIIKQLQDIGADGYLIKNSPKAELINAIKSVAAGNQYFSESVNELLQRIDEKPSVSAELAGLTEREIEIITLIAEGLSNKEIGEKLFISHRTVDTHRTNLMTKLNLHNVAGIVKFAMQNNLLR
jgi:two-component system, NarL family, nitrate/nitrite response regulator NarL